MQKIEILARIEIIDARICFLKEKLEHFQHSFMYLTNKDKGELAIQYITDEINNELKCKADYLKEVAHD